MIDKTQGKTNYYYYYLCIYFCSKTEDTLTEGIECWAAITGIFRKQQQRSRAARAHAETGKKRRPRRASGGRSRRPVSLLSKPQKEKSFSKKELVGTDLEETAGTVSLPKRKSSFPKGEPDSDPEESGNKSDPEKKRKFSPKEKPLSSGPEEAATARAVAARKRKSSESHPRKIRADVSLMGHNLKREVSNPPLQPNKNKNI